MPVATHAKVLLGTNKAASIATSARPSLLREEAADHMTLAAANIAKISMGLMPKNGNAPPAFDAASRTRAANPFRQPPINSHTGKPALSAALSKPSGSSRVSLKYLLMLIASGLPR
jgi:hypothetical protein